MESEGLEMIEPLLGLGVDNHIRILIGLTVSSARQACAQRAQHAVWLESAPL